MPDSPTKKNVLGGQIRLSPRLQAVADLVPVCRVAHDIGTDHGWLPIWLVQQGYCEQAVAADLRVGPLQRASSHIRRYGLSDRIETSLTDGLAGHEIGDDDVVILAGLGGHEIMRIVSAVDKPCPMLVIQAMKSLPELRHFLCERGYRIEREILARERHRFYPVMQVRFAGISCQLTDLEAWVGPVILTERPCELPDYLVQLQHRIQKQMLGDPQMQSLSDQINGLTGAVTQ
ncbi:MAG: class I SAM-dependent methyltransferase [Bacillota bacterium]|nr:class I SAM-dependent methyltransferase [Bacillota bacterium]